MKKLILITLLLLQIQVCTAQIYIDKSISDIKLLESNKTIDNHICSNGTTNISINMNNGTFIYYLDTNTNLVKNCIQIPYNLLSLDNIIKDYNRDYIIITDTIWKTKEGILITLNIGIDEIYFGYIKI